MQYPAFSGLPGGVLWDFIYAHPWLLAPLMWVACVGPYVIGLGAICYVLYRWWRWVTTG
jgi:hypothetical protein